jgi:diguanylate cyclase
VRSHDVPGRYGGEEFAGLFPGIDAQRAAELLYGARRTIASAALERSAQLHATVSIGVAQLEPRHQNYRDWIAQADQALQAAKAQGGDHVARRDALDWTDRSG